jgi:hypothetical protein
MIFMTIITGTISTAATTSGTTAPAPPPLPPPSLQRSQCLLLLLRYRHVRWRLGQTSESLFGVPRWEDSPKTVDLPYGEKWINNGLIVKQ